MSLDTYANLQTEVLAKLVRTNDTDAVSRVVTWITLAEDEMRMALTRLLVRQGEIVNAAYSIAAEYNNLPSGFFRGRSVVITSSSPKQPLDYVPPLQADKWNTLTSPGLPKLWTLQNNQLRVFPAPDATYTASFTHFALPSLSAGNTTNWLLTAHPKLYFKAVLAEAYDYYEDDDNYQSASADRDRMLTSIYTSDGSDQQGTVMRMRTDNGNP